MGTKNPGGPPQPHEDFISSFWSNLFSHKATIATTFMFGGLAPLGLDTKHPALAIEKIVATVVQTVQLKMHAAPIGYRWMEKLPFSNE